MGKNLAQPLKLVKQAIILHTLNPKPWGSGQVGLKPSTLNCELTRLMKLQKPTLQGFRVQGSGWGYYQTKGLVRDHRGRSWHAKPLLGLIDLLCLGGCVLQGPNGGSIGT